MRVENIGREDVSGDFERGQVQRCEADVIVEIFGAPLVIDPGARVERRAIDEQVTHTLAFHLIEGGGERVRGPTESGIAGRISSAPARGTLP